MPTKFLSLTLNQVDYSPEINDWLLQFKDAEDKIIAKNMLLRLRFVSKDTLTQWLKETLKQIKLSYTKHAIYAVRKLEKPTTDKGTNHHQKVYFDKHGKVPLRPGESQGSEDLINSVVSNFLKANTQKNVFFDHPSIETLRSEQIKHLILVDDSIGSGKRINEFINAMLANRTFKSWWSFGWLKITIISYTRNKAAETLIYSGIKENLKASRKYRNTDKISFVSARVYANDNIKQTWGNDSDKFYGLCQRTTAISKNYRLGYNSTFSNIVFLHSAPNNLPGIFWFHSHRWQGLMPCRSIPSWLIELLTSSSALSKSKPLSNELVELIQLVKKGIRSITSLALRLNIDTLYAKKLLKQAKDLGLITSDKRLTEYALEKLHSIKKNTEVEKFNYELYIPSSWSVG